jgi:hypothetical protein
MATITEHRGFVSYVKQCTALKQRKMRKYRLIYDAEKKQYNGGIKYHSELGCFLVHNETPVIKQLALELTNTTKSIERVYCLKSNVL